MWADTSVYPTMICGYLTKVSDLLVIIKSGCGSLLESEKALIHRDHALAKMRIDAVKVAVMLLFFLLSTGEEIIVVFVG